MPQQSLSGIVLGMKLRTTIAGLAAATAVTLSPAVANADAIDDALAKLPSGPISCEQAEKYWTNEADYNNKVAQARTVAMFDSRGPQILDALARVDEAANRCGLKGGGANPAPANPAPRPGTPAPSKPAPAPSGQLINLAPHGTAVVDVPVADVATVRVPDLLNIIKDLLATFNIQLPAGSSDVQLPAGSSL